MWNSNDYRLELQLSIRETECTKASGRDPFTCGFRVGPYVPTAVCKSVVEVSSEQIVNVIVRCHQSTFSSESMSSEEMVHMLMTNPSKRGSNRPEAFSSRGRGRSNGDWRKPDYTSPGRIE
uniref:Secreted phosphoprotein 24 n=1 Tax=Pavo cristatus TaxID=9049 RepID=A0A8C9L9N1_PAVCR